MGAYVLTFLFQLVQQAGRYKMRAKSVLRVWALSVPHSCWRVFAHYGGPGAGPKRKEPAAHPGSKAHDCVAKGVIYG
jgi:hypothetical protein